MRWATLVLAVVLTVGLASVAAAESAWVLWVGRSAGPSWTIQAVYETRNACEHSKDNAYKDRLSRLKSEPGVKNVQKGNPPYERLSYSVVPRDGSRVIALSIRFMCLPEATSPIGSRP